MRTGIRAAAVVFMVGFLAAGCVDESDGGKDAADASHDAAPSAAPAATTPAGSSTVSATLNEWSVTLSSATVPHGTVSFEIRNAGTEDHAFEVEGSNQEWKTEPIKPGEAATLSAVLTPGTYTIYCPIASGGEGHADRGMKTTITVQ